MVPSRVVCCWNQNPHGYPLAAGRKKSPFEHRSEAMAALLSIFPQLPLRMLPRLALAAIRIRSSGG